MLLAHQFHMWKPKRKFRKTPCEKFSLLVSTHFLSQQLVELTLAVKKKLISLSSAEPPHRILVGNPLSKVSAGARKRSERQWISLFCACTRLAQRTFTTNPWEPLRRREEADHSGRASFKAMATLLTFPQRLDSLRTHFSGTNKTELVTAVHCASFKEREL